jgi:hypothetical protein
MTKLIAPYLLTNAALKWDGRNHAHPLKYRRSVTRQPLAATKTTL